MPQGPTYLHARFGDDWTAWTYLRRRGFHQSRGVVTPPHRGYLPLVKEAEAISYLVMEWDWGYDPAAALLEPLRVSPLLMVRRWLSRVSSGPLRVVDKHLGRWQMWWVCVARYELRKRWYYATGRRKEWDEGAPLPWPIGECSLTDGEL